MNMTGLEQFHQGKSNNETDSSPFEASDNGLKHPGEILAQANQTLNSLKLSESSAHALIVLEMSATRSANGLIN